MAQNTLPADAPKHLARPLPAKLLLCLAIAPCLACLLLKTSPDQLPALQATKSRPSLLFATYLYHHGDTEIELKPTLESVFRFRNEGSEPVEITSTQRSCGCMSPTILPRVVQPGETGSIVVPIATVNQNPGPQEYTLNVRYNDPAPRETTLTIKAVLPEKMVTVSPPALFLSQKSRRSFPLPTLTVSDYRTEPLNVQEIYSTAPFIAANIEDTSSKIQQVSMTDDFQQNSTNIIGRVSGSIPPGRHHALIAATTDDPEYPVITVPMIVRGPDYKEGQAAVIDPVQFRLVASDHPAAQKTAQLQLMMPISWEISHVQTWPEQMEVKYSAPKDVSTTEKLVHIEVSLAGLPPENVKHGIIQLEANGGKNIVTAKATFVWP